MLHERREIWKGTPEREGAGGVTLTTYVADGQGDLPAVVVCPGGGYGGLSPREGEPVALAYVAAGFHAFVLEYRVAPHRHPAPIRDLARAVALIRQDAERYRVDRRRIAVLGFSAGGHLAASLGVHWSRDEWFAGCAASPEERRPDALVLCYPVITSGPHANMGSFRNLLGDGASPQALGEMSLELQVTAGTPPAFLWHTAEDTAVPVANSLLFSRALADAGVPFELHVFPRGPHGLSLSTPVTATPGIPVLPEAAVWLEMSARFLRGLGAPPRG